MGQPLRIATVSVRGRDEKSAIGQVERRSLIIQAGHVLADAPPVDAVVFPGGFGFLENHRMANRLDEKHTLDHPLAEAAHSLSSRLSYHGTQPPIIMGFDTAPYQFHGHSVGGQQLALAFNRTAIIGFARKIFPVNEDVDGRIQSPFVLHESDYDDSRRIIMLGEGHKAILCVCYDMFGVVDAARGNSKRLAKAVHVKNRGGYLTADRATVLQSGFAAFQEFLCAQKTDVAISTIHRFAAPGRDVFWQRHGIAAASAALGKMSRRAAFAVAACHIGSFGQDDQNACRLAAWNVPRDHLTAGSQRQAHTFDAEFSHILNIKNRPSALIRIFQPI